jgi:hypothetical protein
MTSEVKSIDEPISEPSENAEVKSIDEPISEPSENAEVKSINMLEYVNTAVRNMSRGLCKLSESDIQCDGVSDCHEYSTIISDLNAYVFNSPHQHRILLTCGKCRKAQSWKSFFEEYQVIQHNCLFCGVDPVDCDKKWFYQEQESISICDDCFTSDLTDRFIALQSSDIPNYYVLGGHAQLINLTPLIKLDIPEEVKDKITPDRVSIWFDHIADIKGIDNSMQRIATWLPFTDLVVVPNVKQPMDDLQKTDTETETETAVSHIMLINCDGGQIAKALISSDGVFVKVVADSIQDYGESDITNMFNSMSGDCSIC